mgnify:CR=1 FL=1
MSETKYIKKPCSKCQHPHDVINPYWLKECRKKAKISFRELSKKTNKSASYFCDIEHGYRNCTAEILKIYEDLVMSK